MKNYLLRDLDEDLWRQVRARAAGEGRSVRFVLMALLKAYANHGFKVAEKFNGRENGGH